MSEEFRRLEDRLREGTPVRVMAAVRTYDTDRDDLWNALTDRERIPRWFLPVEGDLQPGGRYQLKGNAGGTILRCWPPEAFELTWEFGGSTSWVNVRLDSEGPRTRLTLEHIVPASDTDEHWAKFGPGAVGVGWDLALWGLGKHVQSGGVPVDPKAASAWMGSPEGKAFMRSSAQGWYEAHVASGGDPEVAHAMAERTLAAYTGG